MKTKNKTKIDIKSAVSIYLIALFGYFPLAITGYGNVSETKYTNFIVLTIAGLIFAISLWLVDMGAYKSNVRFSERIKNVSITTWFFVGLVAVQLLSTILCKYDTHNAWLGEGRSEGMLLMLLYAVVFLGVSAFGSFERLLILVLSAVLIIMNVIAFVQLCGVNVFGLYPGDSMYDKNYFLKFFSTIGNIDILAAFYCVAVPLVGVSFVVFKQNILEKLLILTAVVTSVYVVAEINVSAAMLSFAVVVPFALPILMCRNRLPKILVLIGSALFGVALSFMTDRALNESQKRFELSFDLPTISVVLVVLAVVFVAVGFLLKGRCNLPVKSTLIVGYAVMIAVAVAVLIWIWKFAPTDKTAPDLVREVAKLLRGEADEYSGTHRVAIWKCSLMVFAEHPILGTGAGAFKQAFSQIAGETYKAYSPLIVDSTHNEWLQIACSFGAMGLIAYLGWLGTLFVRACRKMSQNLCLIPLTVAFVGYVVQSLFSLSIVMTVPFLLAIAGLMNAECKKKLHS